MLNDSSKNTETGQPVEIQPAAKPAHWGPLGAIGIAVLLFVMAQLIGSLVIAIFPHLRGYTKAEADDWVSSAYIQFLYVMIAEALTVGGLLWFMKKRGQTLRDIGWRRFKFINIIFALAGFGVYFVGYIILVAIASSALKDLNVNQQQDIGFNQVVGSGELLVTFLSLVVLPPLVEELLFRGFLFTNFRKRMKFIWGALLTSLLFAAPHLLESQGGGLLWIGAIDTFTLSLVLCYMREKTNSLWSGILLHAMKNGLAFLTLYVIHAR